jgi:hypothetical protein
VSGVLTGYAYETIPNKAIVTGETRGSDDQATLGTLAMGSPGLSVWRRKDSAASENN